MTPRQLLDIARAEGVEMLLTQSGRLRLVGLVTDVDRWLAVIAPPPYRDAIVAELSKAQAAGQIGALQHEQQAAGASASTDAAGRVLAPAIDLTSRGMEQ